MSLPNVMINFKQAGVSAIQRGERGIVALVLNGEKQEVCELGSAYKMLIKSHSLQTNKKSILNWPSRDILNLLRRSLLF